MTRHDNKKDGYGFIVFEDIKVVNQILKYQSLIYDGHILHFNNALPKKHISNPHKKTAESSLTMNNQYITDGWKSKNYSPNSNRPSPQNNLYFQSNWYDTDNYQDIQQPPFNNEPEFNKTHTTSNFENYSFLNTKINSNLSFNYAPNQYQKLIQYPRPEAYLRNQTFNENLDYFKCNNYHPYIKDNHEYYEDQSSGTQDHYSMNFGYQ